MTSHSIQAESATIFRASIACLTSGGSPFCKGRFGLGLRQARQRMPVPGFVRRADVTLASAVQPVRPPRL